MATVGVRELKNRLSEFLRRVADGERVTVTDRGRPVAVISPPLEAPADQQIAGMVREGLARWAGGTPRGAARPPRIRGKPIARTVSEERR
jgi:prevent-host-death family protein